MLNSLFNVIGDFEQMTCTVSKESALEVLAFCGWKNLEVKSDDWLLRKLCDVKDVLPDNPPPVAISETVGFILNEIDSGEPEFALNGVAEVPSVVVEEVSPAAPEASVEAPEAPVAPEVPVEASEAPVEASEAPVEASAPKPAKKKKDSQTKRPSRTRLWCAVNVLATHGLDKDTKDMVSDLNSMYGVANDLTSKWYLDMARKSILLWKEVGK